MKEEKMLRAFSQIDDDLVENAAPKEPKTKKALMLWKRLAYVAVAACLMLCIVLPILFGGGQDVVSVPFSSTATSTDSAPATDRYGVSEYAFIIEELKAYYQKQEELWGSMIPMPDETNALAAVTTMPAALPEEVPTEPETPDDITDNQVAGVIEADLIKRTNTHIFYLRGQTLEAYTIKGKDSEKVGSYPISVRKCNGFYLLDSGKKALILTDENATVNALLLDVSDPTSIREIKQVTVGGSFNTSRVTDDKILLFTHYYIEKDGLDYEKPETFVPTVTENGSVKPLAASDILMRAEHPFYTNYGVVYVLNSKTLATEGSKAIVGGLGQTYISNSHVVLAKSRYHEEKIDGFKHNQNVTDIICLSYTEGLVEKGRVTLDGYTKDQYSFDEKDGILRVVTTINEFVYRVNDSISSGAPSIEVVMTTADPFDTTVSPESNLDSPEEAVTDKPSHRSYYGASLFCVSLDSLEIMAKVERFAPNGEVVQSVRFDGDYAYVCTSIQFTDPVFFFDLSDLSNITYTDTGVIDGYSSSMIGFGEGNLLGIGYYNFDTAKIEVYRESGDNVVSVDRYLIPCASISSEYKAYYVDRKNQLLGLGVSAWGSKYDVKAYYLLLYFDGEQFVELANLPMAGPLETYRSAYLDGYLYVFSQNADMQVVEVTIPQ